MIFKRPTYCQRPEAADCWHCDLASGGSDCEGKSIYAVQIGSRKSARKSASSRENGRKGGRPRKTK